jgi:hypothetical protein
MLARRTLNKIPIANEVDGNHVARKYKLKTSTAKCIRTILRDYG